MRVSGKITDIDYRDTKNFFQARAGKFSPDNPYSVTMYQDHNRELAYERNQKEIDIIKPMLQLDEKSRVLDVACGIGRWADAVTEEIDEYCGIDFSGELIAIANGRNAKQNFFFYEGAVTDVERVLSMHKKEPYNTVLLIGILMYINDMDIADCFRQVERLCSGHAKICIREPVGLVDRLTLRDFYSEELEDRYHAIYRTRDEIWTFLNEGLLCRGFSVEKEGFLFEEKELNNRKETAQYYFLLSR